MLEDRKYRKMLFIILLFAFLVRIFWIFKVSPAELTSDPYYYDKTARCLLQGEGYHNGKLLAYRPPGYPYFLAGIYFTFGYNHVAVKVIQAILSIFSCVFIYLLTKKMLNEWSALLACCLFAFYPQFIRYSGELWSETLFIFLFLLTILFLYKFIESWIFRDGMIAGMLIGIAALTREIMLFFIIPIGVWIFLCINGESKIKKFIKKFGIIMIFALLTISPWTIRNYIIFQKFIPISTNGGINFYMGNNQDATGDFLWRIPSGTIWPDSIPNATLKESSLLELEICKKGYRDGVRFIINNPSKFIKLSGRKLFLLWRPPYYKIDLKHIPIESLLRVIWLIFYTFLLITAIPAMFISIKKFGSKWLLLHFWIIFISTVHMLTYTTTRYRLTLIPVLIIFTALTASEARCWMFKNSR